jgi:hypothetical protein
MLMHAVSANAVGVTTGERNGERILRESVALTPNVALVGMTEADDVSLIDGAHLPPDWRVIHRGADMAKDGVLLAYDETRVKVFGEPQWNLGAPKDLPGVAPARMQDRWFLTVWLMLDYGTPKKRRRKVTVGHFPPPDAPSIYWHRMAANARQINPDLLFADFNAHRARLAAAFPRRVIRVPRRDVVGVIAGTRHQIGLRARSVVIPGSDHFGTLVAV